MKNILFALVFTFISGFSYAQDFDFRAYGGFNILQLTSDQGESIIDGILHDREVSGRLGSQFGISMTFGTRFYIQPGVQFTSLSTEIVNVNTVTDEELVDETKVNAISVPLRAGFRFINPEDENFFNIRIFGGFDGAHVTSVDFEENSSSNEELDKSDFSNLIISSDFGMGVDLFIFYLDMGYQVGLTPVFTGGDSATANNFYSNAGIRLSF